MSERKEETSIVRRIYPLGINSPRSSLRSRRWRSNEIEVVSVEDGVDIVVEANVVSTGQLSFPPLRHPESGRAPIPGRLWRRDLIESELAHVPGVETKT